MKYYITYTDDFNVVTPRVAISIKYSIGGETNLNDDIKYIPASIYSQYQPYVKGKGYCNTLSTLRRIRLYYNTDNYIIAVLPNYNYKQAIEEINNKNNLVRWEIIGDKINDSTIIDIYGNTG